MFGNLVEKMRILQPAPRQEFRAQDKVFFFGNHRAFRIKVGSNFTLDADITLADQYAKSL